MENGPLFSQVEALSIAFSRFVIKLIGNGLATKWCPHVSNGSESSSIGEHRRRKKKACKQLWVHGTSKLSH
jgi:hypothetical protein